MKLTEIQVHHFKNFLDSTPIKIEPNITCLVGKNESGKTAVLHALYRSNPARVGVTFSVQQQYPAWLEKLHRREGKDLAKSRPIRAVFKLETKKVSVLESLFRPGTL